MEPYSRGTESGLRGREMGSALHVVNSETKDSKFSKTVEKFGGFCFANWE